MFYTQTMTKKPLIDSILCGIAAAIGMTAILISLFSWIEGTVHAHLWSKGAKYGFLYAAGMLITLSFLIVKEYVYRKISSPQKERGRT